ncbi:MAG: hypothetical protein ABI416_13765 [Ginsengibacter sp.]
MSIIKIVTVVFLVLFAGIQISCNSGDQSNNAADKVAASTTVDTAKTPENSFRYIHFTSKMDTSCGMPLTAGIADTLHLGDKIYGFCSEECKDDFAKKLVAEKRR